MMRQFKDQHNKDLWPELKEKMALQIKLKSRSEWVEIFSEVMHAFHLF